jgi:hypothetical protein
MIWTKVPSIPASATTTIYVWYGNPQATSAADGVATFVFFDDFQTANTTMWDFGAVNYSVSNGVLTATGGANVALNPIVYKLSSFTDLRIVSKQYSSGTTPIISVFMRKANASATDRSNAYIFAHIGSSTKYIRISKYTTSLSSLNDVTTTYSPTTWEVIEAKAVGSTLTVNVYFANYTLVGSVSASDTSFTSGYVGIDAYYNDRTEYIDWIFATKIVLPEPSASVGNEISMGNAYDESNGNAILSANFMVVALNPDYSINSTATVTNQPTPAWPTPGFYYITASADNYYERSLLVNFTGVETYSFYLPPSGSSVYVTFTVFDPSGTFYVQGSRLKLMTNTSTVIDIRLLDTSHRAVMPLILGKLYVVALENDQQSRVVGFVSATSTSITLYVNQLNITVANYAPVIWNCTQNNTIQCAWQTTAGNTSGAKLTIYDVNGNVVTTMTANTANGSITYLQSNATYRFVFQVFNDLQNVSYSFTNFNWTAPVSPPAPNYFNVSAIPQFDIKSVSKEYRLMFFGGLALIVALFFRRSHVPVGLSLSLGIVVLCVITGFLELDRNLILVLAIIVGLSFFELERERGAG